MRRWVRSGVLAVAVAAIWVPAYPASGSGQVLVAPIVERMGKAFATIRTLRATISQQKSYPQLGMSDAVELGTLYIKKKNDRDIQIRVEINSPDQRIITVKDNHFVLFQPKINQAIEGTVDKNSANARTAGGFFAYFFGGISRATEDYNIDVVGDDLLGHRRATHLRLNPRPERRGLYRQVDLWVDNEFWLPIQQQLIEANRDITLVQLLDLKTNVPVADTLFTQKLPSNAQRIRG